MKNLSFREVQLRELEILIDFDELCKKHQLTYSLAYGTLIGAVRHKGFIPWDDDIDVVMPRPDYERLIQGVESGTIILKDYQELSKDRGKKVFSSFLKIFDKRVANANSTTNAYLWIDIFPIDGITEDKEKWSELCARASRLRHIITTHDDYVQMKEIKTVKDRLKWVYYTIIHNKEECVAKINKLTGLTPYGSSRYAGNLSYGFGESEFFDVAVFENLQEIEFEGRYFMAVRDYDLVLRQMYGDYMQLPPEEKRKSHDCAFRLVD